ncbi:MAG: hypothetical protein MJB14_12295 [Spirochaetes bacterium]|nr:hypothetical protein [Spirochaetota bacterium]
MDKNQAKELIQAFRLIIIGLIFWLFSTKNLFILFYPESALLHIIDTQIIGTILIMIGVIIIRSFYPLAYSAVSVVFIIFILIINILNMIFFRNPGYHTFSHYNIFFNSFMLFLIAKLFQNGLKYYGSMELSHRWRYIALILFFGFTVPCYTLTTMIVSRFVIFSQIKLNFRYLVVFFPILATFILLVLYYLRNLYYSFQFLQSVNKK